MVLTFTSNMMARTAAISDIAAWDVDDIDSGSQALVLALGEEQ
ncbi:hypothetical protein PYH37_000379 [Sinorhizobium numidicum]|uniref:Uncharacterized protein n=1 Tax=Sinorhizobium numidicum TaxID=680248 RepID=A0ABY8CVN0_9HYPH|nr:hypothetical protein [Sinorhizobium numidicum]WEX75047.1 hypothetical protein PYH37_000379 [Sinorhizobium numidicum]WEX81041.1 hypothetical protein PYH38_000381 [Sinorhizobium numidicum]